MRTLHAETPTVLRVRIRAEAVELIRAATRGMCQVSIDLRVAEQGCATGCVRPTLTELVDVGSANDNPQNDRVRDWHRRPDKANAFETTRVRLSNCDFYTRSTNELAAADWCLHMHAVTWTLAPAAQSKSSTPTHASGVHTALCDQHGVHALTPCWRSRGSSVAAIARS
jgi:hypothetical protein